MQTVTSHLLIDMLASTLPSPMAGNRIYSTGTHTYMHNTHSTNRPVRLFEIHHSDVHSTEFLWDISHEISSERFEGAFKVSWSHPKCELPSNSASPHPPSHFLSTSFMQNKTAVDVARKCGDKKASGQGGKDCVAMRHPARLGKNSRHAHKSTDSSAATWVLFWLCLYCF